MPWTGNSRRDRDVPKSWSSLLFHLAHVILAQAISALTTIRSSLLGDPRRHHRQRRTRRRLQGRHRVLISIMALVVLATCAWADSSLAAPAAPEWLSLQQLAQTHGIDAYHRDYDPHQVGQLALALRIPATPAEEERLLKSIRAGTSSPAQLTYGN